MRKSITVGLSERIIYTRPTACAGRSRDSLQRLGVDSLDIAFVHDISPDFAYFPNGWEEQYEIARKGAFPALSKMRDEAIIRAWGIGVNTPLPILKVMDDADPDVCLTFGISQHGGAFGSGGRTLSG